MELNKKNYNSILNNFIAGVTLVLVSIFIALCFVSPYSRVRAITKDDIKAYNIYFVSALTSVRSVTGIDRVQLTGKDNNNTGYSFYSYQYNYDNYTDMELFYGKSGNVISDSVNGNVSLMSSTENSTPTNDIVYTEVSNNQYDRSTSGFIPYGAKYYNNISGQKEEIFYNEIDNDDYVLIDNYDIDFPTDKSSVNIENFYLSFGTPYIDDLTTTPLYDLRVEAKLYSGGRTHYLALNEVLRSNMSSAQDNAKYAEYWNQYLDLRNLNAYETNDPSSPTYAVENQQGRYEFTFYFIRYDNKLNPVSDTEETFTYSFYLLDSADYSNYPTLYNAEIKGDLQEGTVSEYYYNFNKETPYINYDPTKYNISYTRVNNKSVNNVAENITSTFVQGTYTKGNDNINYPKGIITYYNGKNIVKQVFILTYYNENKSIVEHLYLSRTNPTTTDFNPSTYEVFEDSLENGSLKFEYKTTTIQNISSNLHTINEYKTTTYENYGLISDKFKSIDNNLIVTLEDNTLTAFNTLENSYVISTSKNITDASLTDVKVNGTTMASFASYPETQNVLLKAESADGVIINNTTLATENVLNTGNSKYYLSYTTENNEKVYTLTKTYLTLNSNGGEPIEDTEIITIPMNESPVGTTISMQDPINNQITIDYIVTEDAEEKSISSLIFSIQNRINVTGINCNQVVLEDIINFENYNLSLDYTYNLELDELGIYDFTYSYVVSADNNKYFINSVETSNSTNYYSGSTNFTTPVNYSAIKETSVTPSPTTKSYSEDLYVVVSAEVVDTKFTMLGKTYTYEANATSFTEDGTTNPYSFDNPTTYQDGDFSITVTFRLETTSKGFVIKGYFDVGSISKEIVSTPTSYSIHEKSGYRTVSNIVTTTTYSLSNNLNNLPNGSEWQSFRQVLNAIENYTAVDTNRYMQITKETSIKQTKQGVDRMHIFGSISYFNKLNNFTDSNYSKLEQIDSKLNVNYVSDVTSIYINNSETSDYGYLGYVNNTAVSAQNFQTKIASLLTKDQIIVTDVTPILWNNFSTLAYNGKKSYSYIYRYTKWNTDDDGYIQPDRSSLISSTYSKDVYCQFDGLYEVVVFYTYENLPENLSNNVYYQLFTFIIDNSSPSIKIEIEKETDVYEELGLNTYTNKNVRISWEVPSYFQNDVYIEIDKKYFNTNNSQYNFNAIYKNNSITTNSGNDIYVKAISDMKTTQIIEDGVTKNYYYVDIKVKDLNSIYDLNGNYTITVHYSTNGKSTFSEFFVIDKMNISGLSLKSVIRNGDGSYAVDLSNDIGSSQIINSDFTFRFDRKESKAKIFVYYDKIELTNSLDFDNIINLSNGDIGVTTKFEVNGKTDNISVGTPYTYEYTHETAPNYVDSKNLLTSNISCLYLFRLQDEAGNEARFIVFFDTTQPRFLISPEPDPETHIVSDDTRVFWGDYKAIKVTADEGFELTDTNKDVTNYSKEDETNKLNIVLRYLNSTNNNNVFNNLKVEKIENDYYILIPVTSIKIQDNEYGHEFSLNLTSQNNNSFKDYYFFAPDPNRNEPEKVNPIHPIVTEDGVNYITLPDYNNNGKVVTDITTGAIKTTKYKVASYNIETILNYQNENIGRYITITYYPNSEDTTTTKTITGAIGEGTFIYSVCDKLNNKTSGLLWMNPDKTETLPYGIFDYSNKLENAVAISNSLDTIAASQLFISSKVGDSIPEYSVTYKHYAYDTSYYTDYNITGIELITDDVNSKETYLRYSMVNKVDNNITKTIDIQLTDEDGNIYPNYSYPYSLEGNAIIADSKGNPTDVYSDGDQYLGNDETRRYSLALNTTTDTNRQSIVTEEGLYIFKRTYTDPNLDLSTLGSDTRIIYRVYYVDRSGIINISTSNSVANTLYNIGSEINFTLGSTYNIADYQKTITAKTIQNNLTPAKSNTSNADYSTINSLFDTNKIQVEFNLTNDKYNFMSSISDFMRTSEQVIDNSTLSDNDKEYFKEKLLKNYLFNQRYFEDTYKLNLKLNVGASIIINEQEDYYSGIGIATYLKNNPMINANTRGNQYNFYLDVGSTLNSYIIGINDLAGYVTYNDDNTIKEQNYLPNNLNITFDISHTAPEGDLYGKYYGRHNYDENKSNTDSPLSVPSIPYKDGAYAILKYLEEGQLDPLSETYKHSVNDANGNYVQLFSTNNETMIFAFSITNDEYQAQIDPNNIKIYKGSIAQNNLIFNRTNGDFVDTTLVSRTRQSQAFVKNEINGTTYYAIIIFDNNLDEIVDKDNEKDYLNYRLLDASNNPDREDYYIQINYVGNSNDYIGKDVVGNTVSFYKTTYDVTVDRIKPTYNLTKLMNLDKYVYNTINTTLSSSNYETVFENYKTFYNFTLDEEQDFERSDLENYFFALDTRENSSFMFESISELDNNGNFYIRQVDKNNYKFSVTPDDYKAYYNAVYLQGHPQFSPSNATTITNETFTSIEQDKYYRVPFSLDGDATDGISASFLRNYGVLNANSYYEIIEEDEAGNYRVYAIYIPQETSDKIVYTYQTNSNESSAQKVTILYGNTPFVESSGMALKFDIIQTTDNFLKATIKIVTDKIEHDIDVILDPNNLTVTVINRTTKTEMYSYEISSKDKNGYTNTDVFISAINEVLNNYYRLINDKTHSYYSEYGYNVYINIVNRIGVNMKDSSTLYNYEIDYVVAGSTLTPIFKDNATNFTMTLEGQKGSTYLTDITVYKFNKSWIQINTDNSSTPQIFDKSQEELKKKITYTFTRGIYKFVFTDNFNRVNEFFYEYGISSSQTGGTLSFSGSSSTLNDGYIYSSNSIVYTYDSSVYNVYIKFIGKIPSEYNEGEYEVITDAHNEIIFNSSVTYTDNYLKQYGIVVITSGNTTTITFSGVKDNTKSSGTTDLSKYQIKTILASTSTNYTWGDELTNKDIFVYDKKIAVYTAVPNVNIKNLSGNTLDTSEHLNLTEDFELVIAWPSDVSSSERLNFNSRIILTRTYNDNGTIKTTTSSVTSGQIITLPGEYTAYVTNDLGTRSSTISFTRGEGEISMYAVYAVNSEISTESKLSPSAMISTETLDTENKVLFTYFITNDYFNYKDASSGTVITLENLQDYIGSDTLATDFVSNTSVYKYIDVRVNSNLSIKTEVYEVGLMEYNQFEYPFVKYMIYSTTKTGEIYIYRFVQIIFVDKNDTKLADVTLFNAGEATNLAENNSIITSTAESMHLNINFGNEEYGPNVPYGDTIYIDRYYNGKFVETTVVDMNADLLNFSTTISQVGLHEFVIRDLAGRVHLFNGSEKLQIYLINEILFTVNDNTPINNQVFNGDVNISIIFNLESMQLYNERTLNIVVTKNGQVTSMPNSSGEFTLSEAGYYSVNMSAITQLVNGNSTQVSTIYNFVIIDTQVANNTFSISKGTGFAIEKLIKIVNGEETDITDTYTVSSDTISNVLLWLSHTEQGNSIFDVTLRYYDSVTESNLSFNFRIWINNESPVFISSIPAGTSTKDKITVNYNPGLIYTQIGKGYITVNDVVVSTIDETSLSYVDTISIEEKGTYWIRLYTDDGTLVDTYKFTKKEPMNNMTKIILVCVAIGAVVIVGLFFFLRRKGRYR